MANFKAWLSAARLRTLPLSVSGIIVGTALAASEGYFQWNIFLLALLTTILFQVLSNFANDYGDGVKGTDNANRVGPERALQSGLITPKIMFKGIMTTAIIAFIAATLLIYVSFKGSLINTVLFLGLGVASIAAALKYTMGKKAYGYHGLGDVFVFIFFGIIGVVGSYFLYAQQLHVLVFLPAITVGLLSVGVLNLNNMRDIVSDAQVGKNTLAVKLGAQHVKKYHILVITIAIMASITYVMLSYTTFSNFIFLLAFIPILLHIRRVIRTSNLQLLDPELKKLALSTFAFAVLFYVSFNIFL
jgi:1,4-dihydroxy-2-naphthoate octaprenyltransferase